MNGIVETWENAKYIITSTCSMLQDAKERRSLFGVNLLQPSADCYMLLSDATKAFCELVSKHYGEDLGQRWTPLLPELLLSHPECCGQTLTLVEQREFSRLSLPQFPAA